MSLPKGWAAAKVNDLGEYLNGMAFKPSDWGAEGIGIIRIQNLTDRTKSLNKTQRAFDERYRVKRGDLLVSWSATLDAFIWDREDALLNQHIFKVIPSGCAEPTFLFYQLRELIAEMAASEHLHGSTMKHINRGPFLAHSAVVPPLAEQRPIVAKLDALTARLSRAHAELDLVFGLARRLRTQTIQVILEGQERSANFLADLCRVGTGATPKRGNRRYYAKGTIPWVTSGAVNSDFVVEATELITEDAIKETNCKIYPAGSLLVALYGEGKTRGKVAALGINAATNQALAVLHDFDLEKIDPNWVKLFLKARYEQTRAEAAGGVQPNLNLGIIKAIRIPVPSLEEQRAAIARMDALLKRADRLEAEAALARALLDRLESSILAKAFRGDLVPQDPNDEPASVLLERIRAKRAAAAPKKKTRGRRVASADA